MVDLRVDPIQITPVAAHVSSTLGEAAHRRTCTVKDADFTTIYHKYYVEKIPRFQSSSSLSSASAEDFTADVDD